MKHSDKRTRLIEAADKVVQLQGFNRTTLADITQEADIPLGNVYYYFKTKEEIGQALINHRTDLYGCQLSSWSALPDPRKRILSLIKAVADNHEMLTQSGCPIGSLCQELHKEGGPLADEASAMFAAILTWLTTQFRLLGKGREAPSLALHLLSALQGASLLTHSFKDPKLIRGETTRLRQWVDSM